MSEEGWGVHGPKRLKYNDQDEHTFPNNKAQNNISSSRKFRKKLHQTSEKGRGLHGPKRRKYNDKDENAVLNSKG